MPQTYTKKSSFDFYATKPSNPRWSWSARSEDGKTVAITCWIDRFEHGTALYRSHTRIGGDDWQSRPGHNEMIGNLAWARDNCEGEVRVVVAVSRDPNANPRSIKECYPQPNLRMRVMGLDEATGDFVLERIKTP